MDEIIGSMKRYSGDIAPGAPRFDEAATPGAEAIGREAATESAGKTSRRRSFAYLSAALAVTAAAALAAKRLFPAPTVRDALADCASAWDAAMSLGKLLFPCVSAFLASFLLAFSPFAMPASLGALALYGAWAGYSFFALTGGAALSGVGTASLAGGGAAATGAAAICAAAMCAASALCLAIFTARACSLSPAARTLRFSSFDGRREAARLTLSFFTLSGAAAVLLVLAALILHFGR